MAGSLQGYFDRKYDVRVMLPKYMCMKESWKEKPSIDAFSYGSWLADTVCRGSGDRV